MTRLVRCAAAIAIGASLAYLFVKRKRAQAAAPATVAIHRPVASNGTAAVLPVVVIPSELPPWWSVAPAVLYPPQYAVTPLILQLSHSGCISQAFIAFDDFEQRTVKEGASMLFPTQAELTPFYSSYIQSACPFFRESNAQVVVVSEAWASREASVFTHVALSNDFVAFLYASAETRTIVSLVFVGTFDAASPLPKESFADVVEPLMASIALLPTATSLHSAKRQFDGKIRVQYRHPQGKGFALSLPAQRCRVVCDDVSGPHQACTTVITAYERQVPGTALLSISTDAVDALLSSVSKNQTAAALRASLSSRCEGEASQAFVADADISIFEDGDAGEAFGSLDSSSSLNSPLIGSKLCAATVSMSFVSASLGFGCKIPSNTAIHQVQLSAAPLVMLFPSGYDNGPVVSVSRLVHLPQGWEQALPTATDDEFVELLKHNIILHMTPWQTRSEHPLITTADVSGQRAFVWMETQDGRTCRTYACPIVARCTSSKATKEEVHAATVKIVQLVLIRWEFDSDRWGELTALLREVMDTVQVL